MNLAEFLKGIDTKSPIICLISGNSDCYPIVNFAANELRNKLKNSTNYISYNADRHFDFDEVEKIISTNSLFAEKNYIEITFTTKPNAAQQVQLINLLGKLDANNYLTIITDKLDSSSASWVKSINQIGIVVNITNLDIKVLINYHLAQNKLILDSEAMALLLNHNSGNIAQLIQDLVKMTILYPKGTNLNLSHILKVSTNSAEYSIYQLSNAYLSGDLSLSLSILENIYQNPEDAILITWLMAEDIRRLIKLKSLVKQHQLPINEAISSLKFWGEAITNFKLAYTRLPYSLLLSLLDQLAKLDMLSKGVLKGDIAMEISSIITQLSKGSLVNV